MEKEQKAVFATRLGLLRNSINMSQEQLASALEIDRGTIAKYETQSRIPSYEHLTLFAKYFKVSTDYLLGISDVQSNDTDMQAVCAYTGLSEEAVKNIKEKIEYFDTSTGSEYAINCQQVVSQTLASDCFWDIAESLIYMYTDSTIYNDYCDLWHNLEQEQKENHPRSYEQIKLESDIEFYDRNVDLNRYHISRTIEKLNDIFDKRRGEYCQT